MGRPLNKKFFGAGGDKVAITAWIPGGEAGPVPADIVKETGNGEYTVTDGAYTGSVQLQAAVPAAEGEARVAVVVYDGVANVQATADADLTADAVTGYSALVGGSGYSVAPTVTVGGDGTGATAEAVIVGGVVTAINITNGGSSYTGATFTLSAPAAGGATEYARIINAHQVKTWEGNVYRWGVGVTGPGTATILEPNV